MKKILFPTDFSAAANDALAYALALTNRWDCELTLLHAYKIYSPTGTLVSMEPFIEESAHKEMQKTVADSRGLLHRPEQLTSVLLRGDAIPTIASHAEEEKYDLIIMGTQGASGLREILLGSITAGLIRTTTVPVLAIPARYAFQPPQEIVLAMDQQGISKPAILSPLVAIAKTFGATIRIFHQDTGPGDIGIDPAIDDLLQEVEHSFHYELEEEEVYKSIRDFTEEASADMLCMIHRRRSFLEDIFHQSATRHTVNRTERPLLVLHDILSM
jgi:nucleotide-binding universal stress UspA family protein